MGRKDADRFKKIEDTLKHNTIGIDNNCRELTDILKASKKDWQDLRNFLTQMIEER